jgi:quinol monooxygenase YgiN
MPVHALVEATARQGRFDELADAARDLVRAVREREATARRADALHLTRTRTVLVHLVFEDALAAEEHRTHTHTEAFAEAADELCEGFDVHDVDALEP